MVESLSNPPFPPGHVPAAAYARLEYISQRFARALNRATELIALRHSITVPEYHILLILSDDVPRSNAELARQTFVSSQAAHQVLADLEQRGLIAKMSHPKNRRVRLAQLTIAGGETLAACLGEMIDVEDRIYKGLAEPERSSLLSSLNNAAEVIAGGYFRSEKALLEAEELRGERRSISKAATSKGTARAIK